jgi:hypothetical protein
VGFFYLETTTRIIRLYYMNVLTTTLDPQPLVIVPRSTTFDTLIFTDDSTNDPVTINIDSVVDKDYYQILNVECALIENRFYNIELFNNGDLIYRGKAFCTDQPIVSFSVNNGQYVSNATTNTFIVYE